MTLRGQLRVAVFIIAVSFPQIAVGQCPPNSRIYIDPRLLPQRPHVTRKSFERAMANDFISPEQKKAIWDAYYNEFQPFRLPYRTGYVVISGTNPCVQQFIPR
jgi:hypothetical protein